MQCKGVVSSRFSFAGFSQRQCENYVKEYENPAKMSENPCEVCSLQCNNLTDAKYVIHANF